MTTTKIDAIPDAKTKARLEFTWFREPADNWLVRYELVLPLDEVDCRGTFDHKPATKLPQSTRRIYLSKENCMRIPLGSTRVGTSNPLYPFYPEGELNFPFRDGAHSTWDQKKLGLEIYAVTERGVYHCQPKQEAQP